MVKLSGLRWTVFLIGMFLFIPSAYAQVGVTVNDQAVNTNNNLDGVIKPVNYTVNNVQDGIDRGVENVSNGVNNVLDPINDGIGRGVDSVNGIIEGGVNAVNNGVNNVIGGIFGNNNNSTGGNTSQNGNVISVGTGSNGSNGGTGINAGINIGGGDIFNIGGGSGNGGINIFNPNTGGGRQAASGTVGPAKDSTVRDAQVYRQYDSRARNTGYSNNPILFDAKPSTRNRAKRSRAKTLRTSSGFDVEVNRDEVVNDTPNSPWYPRLSTSRTPDEHQLPHHYVSEVDNQSLSTDDEISRATMAVYQPVWKIQNSFVADEKHRDQHLDMFKAIRGVATLTLSYLDKTVAAGLATVQQQADNNTKAAILKQISWTNSRIANPQRAALYIDVDEKVEACLAKETEKVADFPSKSAGRWAEVLTQESCPECMENEDNRYSFCVCCAQSYGNRTITPLRESDEGKISLVDKIFFGVNSPVMNDANNPINKFTELYKGLYGDVELNEKGFKFQYPKYTVQQKIKAFRDGCFSTDAEYDGPTSCSSAEACESLACPITGRYVSHGGICGAMFDLISADDLESEDSIKDFEEVSLAMILTARDIINIRAIQDPENKLPIKEELSPELKDWLNTFCDSSSVAAFKKMHVRSKRIVLDHLALNQYATDYERNRLQQLVKRIDSYLALAEADIQAAWAGIQNLETASIKRELSDEQQVRAAAAGALAQQFMARQINGMASFGNMSKICTGGKCN